MFAEHCSVLIKLHELEFVEYSSMNSHQNAPVTVVAQNVNRKWQTIKIHELKSMNSLSFPH